MGFISKLFIFLFHFQGDYESKALFYGKSNPDVVLGCVNIAFSVAEAGTVPAPIVKAVPVTYAYSPYGGVVSPFLYFNRG